MSVEPHNVRFQIGTRVLPPAYNKPIPKPVMSMAEDAALIRKRFRRTFGNYADCAGPISSNEQSRLKALAEREKAQADALAAISNSSGMTARDVAAATGVSYDKTLNVMRALFKAGKIKQAGKSKARGVWVKA